MKSHLDTVLTIYDSILKDASVTWPELIDSFEKDHSYLRRAFEERGLQFFTVVLPSAGKAFDKSLSRGSFVREDFPVGYPIGRKRAKFLFCDLFSKVFDIDDKLLPGADSEAIFFLRQLFYCFKKFRVQCPVSLVDSTIKQFFETDASLPRPHPRTFGSWDPIWPRLTGHPLKDYKVSDDSAFDKRWQYLRFVSDVIVSNIGVPDHWELRGRHGPGVVSEQADIVNKYEFPNWPTRLQELFPYEWFATGILDGEHNYSEMEQMSRLIAVPKTQKGPRLICAEPLSHQWIQQSIWRWLDSRIKSSYLSRTITFDSQENSRNRALYASIDGCLATIDLSEASDRMSCRLVQYVFGQSYLLNYMWACRTNYVRQTISRTNPPGLCMRKFAPMGSALTFPIQSIVFSCISIASYMLSSDMPLTQSSVKKAADMVTVFGDDIIVPTQCFSHLDDMLVECGLKINYDKTFTEGNFRESCGMDAFRGVDITPAYILQTYDGTASSTASIVETSNNFFKRGLWYTSQAIVELIPHNERKLLMMVSADEGGFGLFTFCGSTTRHLKTVYDDDLQSEFSIALTVSSNTPRTRGRGYADLTQYFIEDPSSQDWLFREPWEAGQVGTPVIRKKRARVPTRD